MKTRKWKFDAEHNKVTGIEPGGCRVTIADHIYGVTGKDWMTNGSLMALAPKLAEFANLVMSKATIETDAVVMKEGSAIIRELNLLDCGETLGGVE